MGTSDAYVVFSVASSILILAMFVWVGRRRCDEYRRHHDDRAAVDLLLGVLKVVIAIGLVVSSLGVPLDNAKMALAGLSIVRGALLVVGITLLMTDSARARDR
jgi:hypothetical protein